MWSGFAPFAGTPGKFERAPGARHHNVSSSHSSPDGQASSSNSLGSLKRFSSSARASSILLRANLVAASRGSRRGASSGTHASSPPSLPTAMQQ